MLRHPSSPNPWSPVSQTTVARDHRAHRWQGSLWPAGRLQRGSQARGILIALKALSRIHYYYYLRFVPRCCGQNCILHIALRIESFGLPWWHIVKNPPAMQETGGLIPGSGRSPGEGIGNLHQYSCLENPMDSGAWWAMVHGVAGSDTT